MGLPFLKVENSPFNAEQVELLNRLASTLTPDQWMWLSGYLAGARVQVGQPMEAAVATAITQPSAVSKPDSCVQPEVTVLFGSQTGNAMRLAGEIVATPWTDWISGCAFLHERVSVAAR